MVIIYWKLCITLTIKPQQLHQALKDARVYQETESFKQIYNKRAGVEGSTSQATGRYQLRHCRYFLLIKNLFSIKKSYFF